MPFAHLFSVFVNNIEAIISHGGYPILFLATILEGFPVLGMAIPGHIAILAGGFFAHLGTLKLEWVIVVCTIGAILGDYIGFFVGQRYGIAFIEKLQPYFGILDKSVNKAKALLNQHTGKAMIIGRFIPATRALLPFLVGANHLPAKRFWFFNIIGGILWVVISIFVGYGFGAGFEAAAGYMGRLVMLAVIFGLVIIWGYRFINTHFHVFKKYEIFTLILSLASLYVLTRTLQDAISSEPFLTSFDIQVSQFMAGLHVTAPVLADIARWISNAGDTLIMICLTILLTAFLLWKKYWRSAAIILVSVGATGALVGLFKNFFLRERPLNALITIVNDPSFPSGHASISAAFFIALAYIIATKTHSWVKRELLLVVCTLAFITVGMSRLVLNVHWASDVIAGWALGAFVTASVILLVRYVGFFFRKKAA